MEAIKNISSSAKGVAYLRCIEEKASLDILTRHLYDKKGEEVGKKWLSICPYVGRMVAIRGRYIEDVMARYLDLPQMILFKKQIVRELKEQGLIVEVLNNINYYSIDLLSKNFRQELSKISCNWKYPTICVFEGISYYLPYKILQKIVRIFYELLAPGSVFIMDYFPDFVKENKELANIMNTIPQDGGESCLTYLSKKELKDTLTRFNIVSDVLESDLEATYYNDKICKPIGSIIIAKKK